MSWPARKYPSIGERLAEKTDKTPGHGPNGDCWVWTGTKTRAGYGQIKWPKGDPRGTDYTHRVSYQLHYGVHLDRARKCGVLVLHKCDNPSCIRPDHLFLGDDKTNNADMHRKGRHRTGDQKGVKNPGHKLTDDEVRAIRAFKGSSRAAAKAFGISDSWAWSIKAREAWPHIV